MAIQETVTKRLKKNSSSTSRAGKYIAIGVPNLLSDHLTLNELTQDIGPLTATLFATHITTAMEV